MLFVGVLERYKNVEALAAAWRLVARARAGRASCTWSASGTQADVAEALAREGAHWDRRLEPPRGRGGARRRRARSLLPSASEGLPRVAVESFLRGRAVVGTRAGGIPDIVEDGVNGLLVEPGDAAALAARDRADPHRPRAGGAPRRGAPPRARAAWVSTPEEYADRVRARRRRGARA